MSISKIQREKKTIEFYNKLCQQGIEPNNFELNRMLTEYFDNHILGMPYYAPKKQIPYEASSKDDYNHNFLGIKEDLETIYTANIEANNKAVSMQEYYDLEKTKVLNAISKLNLRIQNISEALKTSSYVKQYSQVFDDMYDIEIYGDKKRNIPYTTSFIDLLQNKVYTEKSNANVNKISLNNATIQISNLSAISDVFQMNGKIENILSDIAQDMYTAIIHSTGSKNEIEITIDIGQLVTFNTVMFSYTTTSELACTLLISDDGNNYIPAYDETSNNYIEWNFNAKTARYIKIKCIKEEPDNTGYNEIKNRSYYEHYYVFKNISIALEEFESKSIFVSKIIDFNDLTSTIRLDATDMIYNNTRIDYFIGFDNETDKIGWDAIENHKDHQLFMFEKRHKIINKHILSEINNNTSIPVTEFGTQDADSSLYKIFKLPDNINRNSLKITPGYNMWSVKRYIIQDDKAADNTFTLTYGDFSELVNISDEEQLFMDCDNYNNFEIRSDTLHIFTQYVDVEHVCNLYDCFCKIVNADDDEDEVEDQEIRIFLNGCEILADKSKKYSFALRKGVNKIQIAILCPSFNAEMFTLKHNINFKSLTNNVFACVPMKYTSNIILEKMIEDNYNYYTIKNNWVYVKCNPDDMIKSDIDDMGYFASYYCLKDDMVGYFKDNHIKFRIMAILTSTDKNVSPELVNFRITGK